MRYTEIMEGPERLVQLMDIHARDVGFEWYTKEEVATGVRGDKWSDESLAEMGRSLIRAMADADPSRGHKYLNWLITRWKKSTYRWEDLGKIKMQLEVFDRLVKSRRIDKRDIMQYRTPSELYTTVKPFMDGELAVNSDDEKARKYKTAPHGHLVHDGETMVVIPLTFEASRYWGSNTNWCTVADERYFTNYSSRGPLFILLHKSSKKRFQFHFETGQFLDTADQQIAEEDWHPIADALDPICKYVDFTANALREILHQIDNETLPTGIAAALLKDIDSPDAYKAVLMNHEKVLTMSDMEEFFSFVSEHADTVDLLEFIKLSYGLKDVILKAANDALRTRDFSATVWGWQRPDGYLTAPLDEENMRKLAKQIDFRSLGEFDAAKVLSDSPFNWLVHMVSEEADPALKIATGLHMMAQDHDHRMISKGKALVEDGIAGSPQPTPTRTYEKNGHEIAEYEFLSNQWQSAEQSIFVLFAYLFKNGKNVLDFHPPKVLRKTAFTRMVSGFRKTIEDRVSGKMIRIGNDAMVEFERGDGITDRYTLYANGDYEPHRDSLYELKDRLTGKFKFMASRLLKIDVRPGDEDY